MSGREEDVLLGELLGADSHVADHEDELDASLTEFLGQLRDECRGHRIR